MFALGTSVFFIELKYKTYKAPADYLFENYNAVKNDSSLIIIGNSHLGEFHKLFPASAYKVINFSIGGQDLFREYTVIHKLLAQPNKIKKIMLGLDYDIIGYNQVLSGQDYIDKQYYKYVDTLYEYSAINCAISSLSFFRANRDISFLFKKPVPEENKPEINFIPLTTAKNLNAEDCKNRAMEHTAIKFNKALIAENSQLLEKLIALCKTKKIELILLNLPKSNCYRSYSNAENIQLGKNKIIELLQKHQLIYYDLYDDTGFFDDDFTDYDHLNEKGIKKVYQKLNYAF